MLCPAITHWMLPKRTSCVPQVYILSADRDANQLTDHRGSVIHARLVCHPIMIQPINLNKILSGNGLSYLTMKLSSFGSPFLSFSFNSLLISYVRAGMTIALLWNGFTFFLVISYLLGSCKCELNACCIPKSKLCHRFHRGLEMSIRYHYHLSGRRLRIWYCTQILSTALAVSSLEAVLMIRRQFAWHLSIRTDQFVL